MKIQLVNNRMAAFAQTGHRNALSLPLCTISKNYRGKANRR